MCGNDLLSTLGLLTVGMGYESYFPRVEDGALKKIIRPKALDV